MPVIPSSNPNFATAADLASMLQVTFSDAEADAADLALSMATAAIRNYTRQTISLVTNDVVILRGTYAKVLPLPERPVVDVTSVRQGAGAVTTASYLLIRDELWWGASALNVGNLGEGAGGWGHPVEVTYSHGYAAIPDDIKGVCLAMASRSVSNPAGATQISIDMGPASISQQFPESVPRLRSVFTEGEKEVLNLYRRRVTCSSL